MKHRDDCDGRDNDVEEVVATLCRYGPELGLRLSDHELKTLSEHLLLVLEYNARLNLTRITSREEGARLHILDSLSALEELTLCPNGAFLDLGTGGGFPGVPLAVVSRRCATLLDSVAKKAAAVGEIIDRLGLGDSVRCVALRAEELALVNRAQFSAVVARAVAPLPSLVELASPLLSPGGRLIALKGAPCEKEVSAGAAVAAVVGMREVSRRDFNLPGKGEARTIVSYERRGHPKVKLPRRTGLAQHAPLA